MGPFVLQSSESTEDLLKASLDNIKVFVKSFGENYLLKDFAQKFLEQALKQYEQEKLLFCKALLLRETSSFDIVQKMYQDLARHDAFYEELHKNSEKVDKLATPLPKNSNAFDESLAKKFHEKLNSLSFQEIDKRATIAHEKRIKYVEEIRQQTFQKETKMLDNFKFEITLEEDELKLLPQVLLLNQKINNADNSYYYIKPSSKDRVVISRCHPEYNQVQEKYPLEVLLPLIEFKLKQLEAIPDPYRSGDGSSYPAFLIKETYHGVEIKRDYVYAGK